MQVPILRIPYEEDDHAFLEEGMRTILGSGFLTDATYVRRFEQLVAESVGARYAVAVNSATSALEVILRALGIEGGSVIVPTNTFLATALATMHAGNRVIFADSDPQTLCLDVDDVERRIAEDTRAVMLVHIGGIISPEWEALKRLCDRRGLALIEDCAHAHGCSINGTAAGTLGIAAAFSFFPTKVLTTGEGGIITTNNEDLHRTARMIRNQGKNPDLGNRISEMGHNFRMNEITALLGVSQMQKAESIYDRRRAVARFYDRALGEIDGVTPVVLAPGAESGYYKYVAYLDTHLDRTTIKRIMREEFGVSLTGEVYAELCHDEPLWERYDYWGRKRADTDTGNVDGERQGPFPGAERISRHHICLPVYPSLTQEESQHVVDSLAQTLHRL